ncbi:MAG: hypothetical protein ABW168_03550 [Sedimenticola sp.]
MARKGYMLDQLGQETADMVKVTKQATSFIAACYDREHAAAVGTEDGKINSHAKTV